MHALEVAAVLRECGITLEAHGDRLRLRPRDRVTPEILCLVREHKPDLLTIARRTSSRLAQANSEWDPDQACAVVSEALRAVTPGYITCPVTLVSVARRLLAEFATALELLLERRDLPSIRNCCTEYQEHLVALFDSSGGGSEEK